MKRIIAWLIAMCVLSFAVAATKSSSSSRSSSSSSKPSTSRPSASGLYKPSSSSKPSAAPKPQSAPRPSVTSSSKPAPAPKPVATSSSVHQSKPATPATSSTGYTKPAAPQASASGYTKPVSQSAPAAQASRTEAKVTTSVAPKPQQTAEVRSSSGYTKPSVASVQSEPTGSNSGRVAVAAVAVVAVTEVAESSKKEKKQTEAKEEKKQSSTGYTKPIVATASSNPPAQAATAPRNLPTAEAKGNRFDRTMTEKLQKEQALSSKRTFEANQARFEAPPEVPKTAQEKTKTYSSSATYTNTRVYGNKPSFDDVYERRRVVYGNWNPPRVVYRASSSYGSWDSTMLWWALWHDTSFGYHHYNDPYYRAWRRDADRLAHDNEELRQKLLEQDREIARMQERKLAQQANYLPPAVANDTLVALSDDAIQTLPVQKAVLRVATGVSGGKYQQIGEALKAKGGKKFQVELVPTSGSAENLALLYAGSVDAAIIQSDTEFSAKNALLEKGKPEAELLPATVYCEYLMLVVGKDSSIGSIKDLKSGNTIYVGPEGSGTALTWSGIASFGGGDYKDVKVERLGYQAALDRVAKDKNSAMLFVAGSDAPLLKRAAASGQFKLVAVDDERLEKIIDDTGDEIYSALCMKGDAYPGLQNGELETLSVEALWKLSDSWIKKYGDAAFDEVNVALREVITDLHIGSLRASGFHPWKWLLWGSIIIAFIVGVYLLVTRINVTSRA
jgi:TRAP transporter TAXI family solute receptor